VQLLDEINLEEVKEEKRKRQSAEKLTQILREQTSQEREIRNTFKFNKKELRQEMRSFRALKSKSG